MEIFIFLFLVISALYAWIIESYHKHWKRLKKFTPGGRQVKTGISVIIPVRNEADNLPELLASLSSIDYPKDLWEVIIVDDHSTDSTAEVLEYAAMDFPLKFVKLQDHYPGMVSNAYKKKAIELGISLSSFDLILTTDADCIFHSLWLKSMVEYYETTGKRCLAGPVISASSGTPMSIFQKLDFVTMQGITGGALEWGKHIMANGANFLYEKKLFYEVGGFSGVDNQPSGDDMLLMQKIKAKYPDTISYVKCSEAIVETKPAETPGAFLQQRIRWASKSKSYSDKAINKILLLVFIYNLFFIILTILVFIHPMLLFLLLLFMLGKVLIEFPFLYTVSKFFKAERLMNLFIFMQPFHILYIVIAGFLGKTGVYSWKGRKIKI